MPPPPSRLRRWLKIGAAVSAVAAVTLVLARRRLVESAMAAALEFGGASEVRMSVSRASPWQVVLDDVRFAVRAQPFAAGRVTFEREHWWTPSVGHVRVERARVPFHADGSDRNPWAWSTYRGGQAKAGPLLPADRLSVDGTLVVKAAALPDQEVEVKLDARWIESGSWTGELTAVGQGLDVAGRGEYRPASGDFTFELPNLRLDFAIWQDFIQRLVILPGGRWEVGGVLTASVQGRTAEGKAEAGGTVRMEDGSLANAERKIRASGIRFEILFEDFDRLLGRGGQLQADEVRVGDFPIRDLAADFELRGKDQIAVSRAQARALGGTVAAASPFNLFLDQQELEVALTADGLALEEILALAENIPARATGRVDGRVPLQFNRNGVRFGTGWLALKAGTTAELELNAAGLLTRGADPKSAAFQVLQKVESGLLRLRVGELRLDIYPPNRPAGRSATLRVAGEPADPSVKAPVKLDLNVNGPIERLINLGLESRVQLGERP